MSLEEIQLALLARRQPFPNQLVAIVTSPALNQREEV